MILNKLLHFIVQFTKSVYRWDGPDKPEIPTIDNNIFKLFTKVI
ncbi:hypothetical protein [Spiroplasma endosymbiont of Megaselia nigra]|nr:hypothetical protein [Spiroplasma endosymbiont of Megaselia nigra]